MDKIIEIIKLVLETLGIYKYETDWYYMLALFIIAVFAFFLNPALEKLINWANHFEKLRGEFQETYNIILPDEIEVQKRTDKRRDNYIVICQPIRYSDAAGSNAVYVGEYVLKTDEIELIPSVVRSLRKNNVKIAPHQIEIEKYNRLLWQREQRNKYSNLQSIIDLFSNRPARFEAYCADVLRDNGFMTFLTPPTNDGGYDIKAYKDGKSYIVECKCYATGNTVGRPLLQKLYGANGSVKADKMIFITTSEFTKTAIKYASEMDMFLIDGAHLMELSRTKTQPKAITEDDWSLTVNDVLAYK